VFVGDATGTVYALLASHGELQFSSGFSRSGPVSGVATVRDAFFVETKDGTVRASKTSGREVIWKDRSGSELTSSPVIADGTVYVGMQDGTVAAFTTHGQPPVG
jgi:outer membrane protein assembly factor BamB